MYIGRRNQRLAAFVVAFAFMLVRPAHARAASAARFHIYEQAAVGAAVVGGASPGPAFTGLLSPSLAVDFGKLPRLASLAGLSLHANAWILQGRGPTAAKIHSLSPIDFIEGPAGARLGDAYLQWRPAGNAVDIKIGQFGLDENFDQNPAAAILLDGNYTYRNIMGTDLPGGGLAYPFEAPGAMIAVQALPALRLRAGIFSGDPGGRPAGGLSVVARNPHGLGFPLNAGALLIAEAEWDYRLPGLGAGAVLAGGLYDNLSRPDLLFSASGQSLAAPNAGPPRADHGDRVFYAGLTQTLWRGADGRRLKGFARIAYAPPDRNLITFGVQGGLALRAPFAIRQKNSLALALAYDRISGRAAALARAENAAGQAWQPIPSAEGDIELAYNVVLTPWLSLTPDLQYLIRPGGGIVDPTDPAKENPNALVALLQTTARF